MAEKTRRYVFEPVGSVGEITGWRLMESENVVDVEVGEGVSVETVLALREAEGVDVVVRLPMVIQLVQQRRESQIRPGRIIPGPGGNGG